MKPILLTILLLLPGIVYSQWHPLYINYSGAFNDVYFINNATGYVTAHEFIFKTTNGGGNWVVCWQDPSRTFRGIRFINPDTGFILADRWIFRTNNAGINWFGVYYNSNVYSALNEIDFVDSIHGFVVGGGNDFQGSFVRTTNGGSTWLYVSGYEPYPLYCVDFINENTGYYGGGGHDLEGQIYKTTNGGLNFAEREGFGLGTTITGISICNYDSGYAVEDYIVYHFTTDGGRYWGVQGLFNYLSDVYAFNFDTVYIIGFNGFITRTTNAGLIWENQMSGTSAALYRIEFAGRDTGYIVGAFGTILKTTNGGVIAVEPISGEIPKEFNLYQNYPNPFNPVTRIKFDIPAPLSPPKRVTQVQLNVYDILGRKVESLIPSLGEGQEGLKPGTYEVSWDASKYPSGVYFCRIQSARYTATRKMVLVK